MQSRTATFLVVTFLVLATLACQAINPPTSTPTPAPTDTPVLTSAPAATSTQTPEPTDTPAPAVTQTPTPEPTNTDVQGIQLYRIPEGTMIGPCVFIVFYRGEAGVALSRRWDGSSARHGRWRYVVGARACSGCCALRGSWPRCQLQPGRGWRVAHRLAAQSWSAQRSVGAGARTGGLAGLPAHARRCLRFVIDVGSILGASGYV
jgi:hypothetical protein